MKRQPRRARAVSATYNHTRGDSPIAPCEACAQAVLDENAALSARAEAAERAIAANSRTLAAANKERAHVCACGRSFTTPQGLGLHLHHGTCRADIDSTAKRPWRAALLAQREREVAKEGQ